LRYLKDYKISGDEGNDNENNWNKDVKKRNCPQTVDPSL
jgi:hypothetical protein